MRVAAVPNTVITVARSFVAAAVLIYFFDLLHQTQNHLLDADGRPFGDDFVNFWSGAFLTLHGRAAEIYDIHAFHAFQQTIVGPGLDGRIYGYPPVMLLFTAPFALISYVPALFVWLSASWYAFYRALKQAMPGRGVLLLALATPAVFINAVAGQNGCWSAALLGGGLSLLERRPYLAGSLIGMMIYKPHLALLLPVALAAGRQWRAIASAALTVGVMLGLSWLDIGRRAVDALPAQFDGVPARLLEDNISGRTISVFIMARSLGASTKAAYWVQICSGVLACLAVALVWFKPAPPSVKKAVLLLGACLATPYVLDYDLVFGAMVVAWLWPQPVETARAERVLQIACGLLLILPLVAAALEHLAGITFGPLFILPAFAVAVQAAFARRDQSGAAHSLTQRVSRVSA